MSRTKNDPVARFRDARRAEGPTTSTAAEKARLLNEISLRQLRDGVPPVAVRAMQDRATKADIDGGCPTLNGGA